MGDDASFSIKQIADLFGNSRGAIRYFQEKGLIEPEVADNGYRSYSSDDVLQLLYLRRFTAMSFSLDEAAQWFKRDSEADVSEVLSLMDERVDAIERKRVQEARQIEIIRECEQTLREADQGVLHLGEAPTYWELKWDHFSAMASEEPERLSALLSLIPETIVGATFDRCRPSSPPVASVRIPVELAQRNKLERSSFFDVLPATRMAVLAVSCEGGARVSQLAGSIEDLAERLTVEGFVPGDLAFDKIILNHTEAGVNIEYHELYLPFEECAGESEIPPEKG